jgi:hypothetical protein
MYAFNALKWKILKKHIEKRRGFKEQPLNTTSKNQNTSKKYRLGEAEAISMVSSTKVFNLMGMLGVSFAAALLIFLT